LGGTGCNAGNIGLVVSGRKVRGTPAVDRQGFTWLQKRQSGKEQSQKEVWTKMLVDGPTSQGIRTERRRKTMSVGTAVKKWGMSNSSKKTINRRNNVTWPVPGEKE